MIKNSFLLVIAVFLQVTAAVDLESAKEQECFPIKNTVRVDEDWFYYPLMSRLELYTTSLEITRKTESPSLLPESDIYYYYDSCLKVKIFGQNNTLEATGFGGLTTTYEFEPQNLQAEMENKGRNFTTESGKSGRTFVTMTDNSNYFFVAYCMDDKQMSWGVTTTKIELPLETVKTIYEHAESLGFKPEYFTRIRYDNCEEEELDEISSLEQLAI